MKKSALFFIIIAICSMNVLCIPATWILKYIKDAGNVVYQETSPSALLKKYSWFKDASARLDAMNANIFARNSSAKAIKDSYGDASRKEWSRADAEAFNQINTEVSGMKAAFNLLAADYNSNMAKINFAFCNVGQLPFGADVPLPREYKSYIGE